MFTIELQEKKCMAVVGFRILLQNLNYVLVWSLSLETLVVYVQTMVKTQRLFTSRWSVELFCLMKVYHKSQCACMHAHACAYSVNNMSATGQCYCGRLNNYLLWLFH